MFKNYGEINKFVKENSITTLDFKYTDLSGKMRHLTMPVSRLSEKLISEGEAFDASSTSGLKSVESGDMVIIPDISTGFRDPFWDSATLSFICRIADAETKEFFHMDPRGVAFRAKECLVKNGIADESLWAPEFEFYLFSKLFYKNNENAAIYYLESEENNRNQLEDMSSFGGFDGVKIPEKDGYHAHPPVDLYYQVRDDMVEKIEAMGFKVRYHHHEVAAASQHEIEVQPVDITKVGDLGQLVKYVIKMIALENGLFASFMPKPLYNRAGTGMHFHQFLRNAKKNIFYKKGEYADLSEIALYYIGGILRHGKALTALLNPSTNSYKRLVPGFEAPTALVYSKGNRSAAVRIPKNFTSEEDKRMEYRTGDATCNIYLASSALLMAGIDGILNKIDPRAEGMGPYDMNIDKLSPEELSAIDHAPCDLEAALDELNKDHDFLLRDGVFSSEMIEGYIKMKKKEVEAIRNRPHPYEIDMYFNC